MFQIGSGELLLILIVALLVVGPKRLPELARSLGKGIRELRRAQDEVSRTIRVNLDDEPGPTRLLPETPAPRAATGSGSPAGHGEAGTDSPDEVAPVHPTAPAGEVAEISKTLGRGLAELRRAREEIQRSFRVDLDEPGSPKRPAPRSGTGPGASEHAAEGTAPE
jgi:Tat protein translocase TatB subunit